MRSVSPHRWHDPNRSYGEFLKRYLKFLGSPPETDATDGDQSFAESLPVCNSRKGFTRSSGRGKMMVEFFSVAISVRVCR